MYRSDEGCSRFQESRYVGASGGFPGRRGQRGGVQVTLGRPSKMHRPAPAGRVDETTGSGEVFVRDQDGIMTVIVW